MRTTPAVIVLVATALARADGPTTKASPVVGLIQEQTIDSAALHDHRTVRVWLPPGYAADEAESRQYDVVYLFDGQNCFDRRTSAFGHEWQVDETLTRLIEAKAVPPVIVVGLDNGGSKRIAEYTFDADPKHGGGHGQDTERFLIDEVMPLIAKTYPVRTGPAHTTLGGSSLGGLLTLRIAARHPDVFGHAMAMSASLWGNGESLLKLLEHDVFPLKPVRVWLDIGTAEEPGRDGELDVNRVRRLDAALTAGHVEHRLLVCDCAHHNEDAWAERFPQAITYLLTGK